MMETERSLTILAAEPVNGADEAVVELRRPAEARVLGADIGAHRRRRQRVPLLTTCSFLLNRAVIVAHRGARAPIASLARLHGRSTDDRPCLASDGLAS